MAKSSLSPARLQEARQEILTHMALIDLATVEDDVFEVCNSMPWSAV
jgi:hypothetical protein